MWQQILLQVVQDSTPKLGGDLDVNGKQIVSSSNADILVKPNGSGKVGLGTASPNTLLQVAGPIATAITTKTANYSISSTDSVVLCDATGGSLTVTLPSAAGISGRQYSISGPAAVRTRLRLRPRPARQSMGRPRDCWQLSISRPLWFPTVQTGGSSESKVR